MEEIGTIQIGEDGFSIVEEKCANLTQVDTDMDCNWDIIYTLDFLEDRPLKNIPTRKFISELERRIEKN